MDEEPGPVHRRQEADVARGEPPTRPQQDLAFGEVETLAPDVSAARRACEQAERTDIALRILLHDDHVFPRLQRNPGEGARRNTSTDAPAEPSTGRHLGDDAQFDRDRYQI